MKKHKLNFDSFYRHGREQRAFRLVPAADPFLLAPRAVLLPGPEAAHGARVQRGHQGLRGPQRLRRQEEEGSAEVRIFGT